MTTATVGDRARRARDFIASAGWGAAERRPLAGDASNRRYDRLRDSAGRSAVFMDSPPDGNPGVAEFAAIDRYLAGIGLSPPAIMAEDAGAGFLLLEDLGDDLFARVLAREPEREGELYAAATDALVTLHRHAPPADLLPYDAATMGDLAALALDWYAGRGGVECAGFAATMAGLCEDLAAGTDVLIQRDYHAENLVWLPGREGAARVGLLDFQDARAGHPAYDLVSVLEDARRDVPPAIREAMILRYVAATGRQDAAFRTAAAVLGAQRNLRILGVFARLCLRDGKPGYLALIPRVWDNLAANLAHPALAPLARQAERLLPPPTPDHLAGIRARCAPRPAPR